MCSTAKMLFVKHKKVIWGTANEQLISRANKNIFEGKSHRGQNFKLLSFEWFILHNYI